jgi:membrane protein YqaA with SNARE-associated domain
MAEAVDVTKIAASLFAIVFVLNVLPAFAPPTWTTMSFIGLTIPDANVVLLALVAAMAATSGRIVLATLSRTLVRQKLLSERAKQNVDSIKLGIERRPAMTLGSFLGYALSPLPSNYLFIAYGLTSLPIVFLAVPFFLGRLVSYSFWASTASSVGDWLDWDWSQSTAYFVAYFVFSQLMLVPVIYCFTRLDWKAVFTARKLRWLPYSG